MLRMGFSRLSNFQRGGLLRKTGLMFFRRSCSLYIEKKLKPEIFNDKNVFKLKCFFLLCITMNLNYENLTKNLATFKR